MKQTKRKQLEAAGWKVGSARDFLGLTDEEAAFIELKLKLARLLREHRQDEGLTQIEVARLVQSSQSRVAKMEAADPTVTLDLLIRTLLRLGVTNRQLATVIRSQKAA